MTKLTNNPHIKIYYDIVMAILAMTIIATLLIQGRSYLTSEQQTIIQFVDYTIWIIFVIDYITRLILAKNKLSFIRDNIIDLISILPLDFMFQGLRTVRLIRVFYMFRVFVYLNRLYDQLNEIITTNNFHHVLWLTFSTIFGGAIAISYVDDMEIGDALWWSIVTTTTVGYGDIAPSSVGGRIIAVFLMIVGIGFLSTLTSTISTYFINKKPTSSSFKEETLQQIIQKLTDFDHLKVEDINNIHKVLLALKKK